jgi:hypothetical protein
MMVTLSTATAAAMSVCAKLDGHALARQVYAIRFAAMAS